LAWSANRAGKEGDLMTLAPKLTRLTAAVTLGLTTALAPLAPAVVAQESQSGQTAPSGDTYTDTQLETFVDAAMAVLEVRNEYAPQVQEAESDQARQQLVQEATQEMQAAVEGTDGIDVETYQAIGQASQGNEELAERINTIVQERQGGPAVAPEGGSADEG
jgi:hypothetical protein